MGVLGPSPVETGGGRWQFDQTTQVREQEEPRVGSEAGRAASITEPEMGQYICPASMCSTRAALQKLAVLFFLKQVAHYQN